MYLSRVEIDEKNRRKIRELNHLGAFHSWVEDSFPDEKGSEVRTRKLWRIDQLQGKSCLLVVSEKKPDLLRLEKYGVPGSAQSKRYDPFLNQIRIGETFFFKATLNPVHSVREEKGKRGKVYPEITAAQQMDFLIRKAEANGFQPDPDSCRITQRAFEVLKKQGQRAVRLSKVTYEGKLTVTDEDLFRRALTKGIGKKKAYGFGMITVIPEGNN